MMHVPKIVVLHGRDAVERAQNLIRSMINPPPNLDGFGGAMVALMSLPAHATRTDEADCLQPFLRQFTLPPPSEDPGFDERIMFEALMFSARQFRLAWRDQVPKHLSYEHYRFHRWLGNDLVLERR